MMKTTIRQIKTALILLISFTLLTGLVYPIIVTLIAQLLFPYEANGSLVQKEGKLIGSALIGQSFTQPDYFGGRPSATTPFPYNAENSSGSNMGPSNPDYLAQVKERVSRLHEANPQNNQLIPVDLVTASGSGLDPDISPFAAYYQISRIAKARHLSEENIYTLIQTLKKKRIFKLFGEPRVNVLQLNMALDNLGTSNDGQTSKS